MKCTIAGCPGAYEPRTVVHTVKHRGEVMDIEESGFRDLVTGARGWGRKSRFQVPGARCQVSGAEEQVPEGQGSGVGIRDSGVW